MDFAAAHRQALGRLLATNPQVLTQVLRIVYWTISGDLLRAAGRTRSTAETGAVTLIQRFASALKFNIHLEARSLYSALTASPTAPGLPSIKLYPYALTSSGSK